MTQQPMQFIAWKRGMEHEWPSLSVEDPRKALFWNERKADYIVVIPIDPRHALLTIDELSVMTAYRCPPYKTISQE